MNLMKSILLIASISMAGMALSLFVCAFSAGCPPATAEAPGQCIVIHPE